MSEASWKSSGVAEWWGKSAAARNLHMAEVTARMFEEAAVRRGMTVLELGAGSGEVAATLSGLVGPQGRVVATDGSASMLETAQRTLAQAGAANVTTRVCDAAAIDLPEASFDAVVARMLLMFVDLGAVLPGVHRVLRDGGRFAAAVWGPVANNHFQRIVLDAARAEGGPVDPGLELAKAFSKGDRALYETSLAKAGFRDVRVHVVGGVRKFADVAAAMASIRESPIHTAPVAALADAKRAGAWQRIERELAGFAKGGAVEMPAEWLVMGAAK
jgi:ubiquinone/menaquinone biosynthesis C-methylase UbiE